MEHGAETAHPPSLHGVIQSESSVVGPSNVNPHEDGYSEDEEEAEDETNTDDATVEDDHDTIVVVDMLGGPRFPSLYPHDCNPQFYPRRSAYFD
ncbi:hypothetical protein Pelo_13295 [Pelomyxa schiedti]|nr:hypothetical protein Pelo_13295 [Pelomyxa schiedti]